MSTQSNVFSQGGGGYQTDDLLLHCNSEYHEHRILPQIKHNITISEKSELFKEVIFAAWEFLITFK